MKLDPKNGPAYLALAWAEMAEKDYDRARTSIESAEQVSARPIDVRAARAELATDESDPKTALRLMKETLSSSDATPAARAYAWSKLSSIYVAVGAVDEADRAYQETLKLLPNDAWSHGNYANFLLRHGKIDAAVTQAEQAVHLMPYPMGQSILSRAYLAKADELWDAKDYNRSADYVEKAARVAGDSPEAYYLLGVLYERASKRMGDKAMSARAEAAYRKALALNPQYTAAQKALSRLAN